MLDNVLLKERDLTLTKVNDTVKRGKRYLTSSKYLSVRYSNHIFTCTDIKYFLEIGRNIYFLKVSYNLSFSQRATYSILLKRIYIQVNMLSVPTK